MKKVILTAAILVSIACSVCAQSTKVSVYKKFRTDFMIGGAFKVKGNNQYTQAYGAIATFEPRYNVTDNIGIGIRFAVTEVVNNPDGIMDRMTIVNSYLANFTYTSNQWKKMRFYTGAGVGVSDIKEKINSSIIVGSPKVISEKTGFAFVPRAGLEVWKFSAELFYNCTGNSNTNFAGLSLGFFLGGGKRK
jgi:opacity protein-like surface antigen